MSERWNLIRQAIRAALGLPRRDMSAEKRLAQAIERNRPRLEESIRRGEQQLTENGGTPLDDLI